MENESLVQLDPNKIQADNNIRFSLLKPNVDALKASILEQGRVNDPVEVEPLNGKKGQYKLTAGFIRHAAVTELNKEGAGLLLPAIVRIPADDKARLRRQLSENVDRKNLSPMDQAIAIQKLLAAEYTKAEIRNIFKRPGGRKGLAMQPASNAWLNMTLSFLELPKPVQDKIHDGRVGVAAAYELTKVAPDKRQAVLDKAEEIRQKELDREEAEEAKLAKQEERQAKQSEKATGNVKKIAEAEEKLKVAEDAKIAASALIDAKKAEVKAITGTPGFLDLSAEAKKAVGEKLGAAKADLRGAEKAFGQATKDLDKAQRTLTAVVEKQEAKAKEAKAAPKTATAKAPAAKKKEAIGPRQVKQAATETGAATKPQPLIAAEMRKAAVTLMGSKFKGAKAIGLAFTKCFDGEMSIGALVTAVEVATGERKTVKA